jgi:hypothetical protein
MSNTSNAWRWLAKGVAGLHFGYLAYLIGGGFLAWRWPKTFTVHALSAGWALLIIGRHVRCPCTSVQNALRVRAGQPPLPGGFIDTYVRGRFFPDGGEHTARAIVGLLVLGSWARLLADRRARSSCHSLSPARSESVTLAGRDW